MQNNFFYPLQIIIIIMGERGEEAEGIAVSYMYNYRGGYIMLA